ncbi:MULTISPECIES: fumarylacetoacetate hydrolase family protein [unclassified Janthinobacterium]|uniref:fumarylacetoacetate hydrolase family protein n=1 Tax=unclassified Janthinobacterium TaxID=2610881 RepID=UPI0018C92D7F|nr:fumarylacetoacetate hydrolase family protein [Janthinobacterium sp. CG_23.4]MDH6159184.1 fumarylacetoacetate (FAA) hydrolase [Janthinobacterium sp. CG_23.4]
MKLATLKDGTRDGQLAVVSRDLKTAHLADGIASTLQKALDDWSFIAPQLDLLYQTINSGRGHRAFEFDSANCMAPLPRSSLRVAGASYLQQIERACKAAGVDVPANLREAPRLYQGASDDFRGAHDDISVAHEQWGIDYEAGIAAITDDVFMGSTPDQAHLNIKLLMLVNDITLRKLVPGEQASGYGLLQAKPAMACSPVAITPDELGDAWRGGKVHYALRCSLNGKLTGQPQAGADMTFNYPQLLAHLCQTRNARAGSVVSAGGVANKEVKKGFSSIFERRNQEMIADGVASTPYLLFGDVLRLDMQGDDGKSLFGAIEQTVKQAQASKSR